MCTRVVFRCRGAPSSSIHSVGFATAALQHRTQTVSVIAGMPIRAQAPHGVCPVEALNRTSTCAFSKPSRRCRHTCCVHHGRRQAVLRSTAARHAEARLRLGPRAASGPRRSAVPAPTAASADGRPGQQYSGHAPAYGQPVPGQPGYYQQQPGAPPPAYQGGPPQHTQYYGGNAPRGNRLFNDEEAGCDIACVIVGVAFFPWTLCCVIPYFIQRSNLPPK